MKSGLSLFIFSGSKWRSFNMIFIYLWGCWFWPYLNNLAGVPTTPVNSFKSFFFLHNQFIPKELLKIWLLLLVISPGVVGRVLCILLWIVCINFMNANWNTFCLYYSLHSLAVKNSGKLRTSQGNFLSFWMSCWFRERWKVHHWRDMPHRRHLWQSPQRSSSPLI